MKKFFLAIPVCNHAEHCMQWVHEMMSSSFCSDCELTIQIVDDGSLKNSYDKLNSLIGKCKHIVVNPVIFFKQNQGKGAAILKAWSLADSYDWIGFMDGDGSISSDEINKIISHLKSVTKSNYALFACRANAERSIARSLTSSIYNCYLNFIFKTSFADAQCGCKWISKQCFCLLFPFLSEKQYLLDVDLIAGLVRARVKVNEFYISWKASSLSNVSLIPDGVKMISRLKIIKNRWERFI